MRSHSFLRKSQVLLRQTSTGAHPIQPFATPRTLRYKRLRPVGNTLLTTRCLSSSTPSPNEAEGEVTTTWSAVENGEAVEETVEPRLAEPSLEELGKIKTRRSRTVSSPAASSKDAEPVQFPAGLDVDILYAPTESQLDSDSHAKGALPPPEIFDEVLDNLMITLHPQNQHRAMLASGTSTRPIEPTLGLYCPIEGGDYVIDNTVKELAFQTGAEVLVLDSVQLAAGEWGAFGKGASSLILPKNPLHFSSPIISSQPSRPGKTREDREEETEEDDGSQVMFATPARMSLNIPKVLTSAVGRTLLTPSARKPTSPSKLENFFETLVNMPISTEETAETSSYAVRSRPRLIYIRDFPTLAASSSIWYPPLLAAVRQRRRKILSRTSNTTSSPVTIIFGMTPPVTHPWSGSSSGSSGSNLMNFLMSRNASSSQAPFGTKGENVQDWSESESAEAAREKRLRSRLRKWERSASSLHDEFPPLSTATESDSSPKSNFIVIGGQDSPMSLPPMLGLDFSDSTSESSSQFFRASVLVPRSRSVSKERETRIARRREINELTMRMGVGAIGGTVEACPAFSEFSPVEPSDSSPSDSSATKPPSDSIWENWGSKIEDWSDVRKISDRAMGSVMASQNALGDQEKVTLAPTVVPWSAIQKAWKSCHLMTDARKNWLIETLGAQPLGDDVVGEKEKLVNAGSEADKVVENIRSDPELDPHEARLLPCIVDSMSIKTTFSQVHLPNHTIDSIRTIVSLPLLHPHAFQQGILKDHSMTGCLLFGPPGTGKTLAVRALAKEAGCRMLAVSPSDVMDMYVGEGEKLVRAVFSLARKLSPCVVFLDEIDALFGARMSARDSGSAFAHRGIITEFMQEMDGLKSSKEDNVIVIGATNRPFDLDDAVLRRLPRRLLVDLPGEKERKEILKILLRDENLSTDLSIEGLSEKTDGFSGSDLKHLCVSAALDSVKEHMQLPWLSRHNTNATSTTSIPLETSSPLKDLLREAAAPASTGASTASLSDDVAGSIFEEKDDSAKEKILQPNSEPTFDESNSSKPEETTPENAEKMRTLHLHNFAQALKEITPSSSESLGSLADLRKWNDEFGEGRRDRKKHQVWGKGRFGFIDSNKDQLGDGRVSKE